MSKIEPMAVKIGGKQQRPENRFNPKKRTITVAHWVRPDTPLTPLVETGIQFADGYMSLGEIIVRRRCGSNSMTLVMIFWALRKTSENQQGFYDRMVNEDINPICTYVESSLPRNFTLIREPEGVAYEMKMLNGISFGDSAIMLAKWIATIFPQAGRSWLKHLIIANHEEYLVQDGEEPVWLRYGEKLLLNNGVIDLNQARYFSRAYVGYNRLL